jgi:outer membrane protein assembly factor BamB
MGRVDMGAYDIPTYEWGPASSPIIWNGLVILQCDTQADSFVLALNAETGETVWKTTRDELPSWGTPTVLATPAGPELVTNASNFIRGYDARTGRELWKLGGSSKITAPTPIAAGDLIVVASGRAPERPIFAVKPGARGDLTLGPDRTSSESIAWSRTGRGSYMPTPLAYQGLLYVLANNGVLDAYDVKTGREIYRERLPLIGSGYSASPVAADGKIYLANEDGDMLVLRAGPKIEHLATNLVGGRDVRPRHVEPVCRWHEAAIEPAKGLRPVISPRSPSAGWQYRFGALRASSPLCGRTTSTKFAFRAA